MRLSIFFILLFFSASISSAQEFNYDLVAADERQVIATETNVDSAYPTLWKLVSAAAERQKLDPQIRRLLEVSYHEWEAECRQASLRLETGLLDLDEAAHAKAEATSRPRRSRRDAGNLAPEEAVDDRETARNYAKTDLALLNSHPYYHEIAENVPGDIGMAHYVAEVLQVVDGQNILAILRHPRRKEELAWVSGIDASRMVDDMVLPRDYFPSTLWRNKGPRKYTTAAGVVNTVREYERVPVSMQQVHQHDDLFYFGRLMHMLQRDCRAMYEEDQERLERERNTREWRDSSGKFAITATFRSVIGDNVKLIKKDGGELLVPLAKLSEADRQWIADRK